MHSPLPNGTPGLHNPFFTSRPSTCFSQYTGFSQLPEVSAPSRSWSEPSLKARRAGRQLEPLAAPPRSPFPALAYLEREPCEFEHQRQLEARRQARKLVNAAWRVAFERLGINRVEVPPWPPKEKPPIHAVPPTAREIYEPQPYRRPAVLEGGGSSFGRSSSSLGPSGSAGQSSRGSGLGSRSSHCSRSSFGQPRYEEAIRKMRNFARLQHGAPYTVGQVHAEVEANIRHRTATDTRALCGFLGPLQLGFGTTRAQRKLPFDNCKNLSASLMKQSSSLKAIKAPES